MSIDDVILQVLSKPVARRSGLWVNMLGFPVFAKYKKKTIQNSLSKLKQKKLITFEGRSMTISQKGKTYLKERRAQLKIFDSSFTKDSPKSLMVMFDIPEARKAEREWFRYHLKQFGYEMIQRSVWYGPSPLPEAFVEYVRSIGLTGAVKVFKVSPSSIADSYLP